MLTFRGLLADPGARVYAANDDTSLFIWWFANGANALAGLLGFGSGTADLLHTPTMNWPDGVNGAWNTSVLGVALPLAPVTWLWGPVVAYNVAIVLSPVAATAAAALFLTRIVDRIPAAAGALLYGFSPYLIAQAGGHLNLSAAILPPLVAAFLWSAATGPAGGGTGARVRAALPGGILLGGVIGWQFYVSTELLAGTFLAALVAVGAVAVVLRGRVRPRLLPFVTASLGAVGTALLLASPLLTTMLDAPGAPATAIRPHGVWINDLLDPVVAPHHTLLSGLLPEIPRAQHLDPAEIGGYLSAVGVGLAVWTVVRHRRSPRHGLLVRGLALTGAGVWLLSMGSPLTVGGRPLPVPGPFRLVEHLPILQNILPMRLSVHVVLVLSALVAVLLHHALRRTPGLRALPSRGALLEVTAVGVLLLLLAPVGVSARTVAIPEAFRDGAIVRVLPQGSVVKALPIPRAVAEADYAQAMVWQASTGMHYRETGGYFIGGTDAHPVLYQSLLDPLDVLLRESTADRAEDLPADAVAEVVGALARSGTEFVLVPRDVPLQRWPGDDLAAVLGAAPDVRATRVGDTWVVDLRDAAGTGG